MSQPKQLLMVRWYDPAQLIVTGIDVATSTLFGRHSDFRLLEALVANEIDIDDDYANIGADQPLWIDYVADVGDGWNSTYAVACALAQPALTLKDGQGNSHETKRGSILMFGGDQVYPVASRAGYEERLVGPYKAALPTPPAPSTITS